MDSPSQRLKNDSISSAIEVTEVKSVLACMARAHAAAIDLDAAGGAEASEELGSDMPCMEKYNVESRKLCADERREVSACTPDRAGKTIGNFIVTTGDMVGAKHSNLILKILSQEYEAAPNFGLIVKTDGSFSILSGNGHRRVIPDSIVKAAELEEGQLVYITQYSASAEVNLGMPVETAEKVFCAPWEQKIFRFNKWECMPQNFPEICTGDTIWRYETQSCEIDPARRPLCGSGQTAVDVDGTWYCLEPTMERTCPPGSTPQLDYTALEWTCVAEVATTGTTKCKNAQIAKTRAMGGTLLKPGNLCNNCERMITDPDTCEIVCIPDETKLSSHVCYPNPGECKGTGRAFYFGFPMDMEYIAAVVEHIPSLDEVEIPMDSTHSQNRKFNCLDCGMGGRIDTDRSLPPFVAVCE